MDSYLKIDNYKLDLTQAEEVPVSYSFADVMNPVDRKKSQSKTFLVPGTKNNMTFFQSAYSMTWRVIDGNPIGFNYDIRQLHEAEYYLNGRVRFRGALQLLSVKVKNKVTMFEVVLVSKVAGIFQQFGDLKISDLDWTEYDHTLNETNIVNSWDTSVIVNSVATANFDGGGVPDGFGYLYGLAHYGLESFDTQFLDSNIIPQVYFREIVTKSFEKLGYNVDETFIGTERFKRLVLGYGGGDKFQLSVTELAKLAYSITADGSFNRTASAKTDVSLIENQATLFAKRDFHFTDGNPDYSYVVASDPSSQATNGSVTIPTSATYRMTIAFTVTYDIAVTGVGTFESYNEARLSIFVNGSENILDIKSSEGIVTAGTYAVNLTFDLNLKASDEYYFRLRMLSTGTIDSPTQDYGKITLSGDFNNTVTIDQTSISSEIINGSTVHLSSVIPEMKITDFLKGLINHFNLNISEPDAEKTVRIEPLEDFYTDNATNDVWTKKIDFNETVEIEPIAINQAKRFKWKFADDKDYYRAIYFDLFDEGYGDYSYDNAAAFAQDENVFELPYTISPPVQIVDTDLIVPAVFQVKNGVIQPFKGKPRIYYYQGLIREQFILEDSLTGSTTTQNDYPQLHHIDDLTNPTFDLCMGTPQQVFYTATDYSTNNSFNEYFWRFVSEVTSVDSKLMRAKFFLTEDDANEDTLKRTKNIDGVLYRLNLIEDFVKNRSTQCELIKILEVKSKQTYITEVVNEKVGQFPDYDPTNPYFGYDTLSTSGSVTTSNRYNLYLVDSSAAEVTITIDSNVLSPGFIFYVKKVAGNYDVIIQPASLTIDDQSEVRIKNSQNAAAIKYVDATRGFKII